MKWSATLFSSAYDFLPLTCGTTLLPLPLAPLVPLAPFFISVMAGSIMRTKDDKKRKGARLLARHVTNGCLELGAPAGTELWLRSRLAGGLGVVCGTAEMVRYLQQYLSALLDE